MLAKFLAWSRYLVIISVIGSFLASVTVTVFAGVEMVRLTLALIRDNSHSDDHGKRVRSAPQS